MLPRKYYPALQGNIYELRAAHAAAQLFPRTEMAIDYDQLLNKRLVPLGREAPPPTLLALRLLSNLFFYSLHPPPPFFYSLLAGPARPRPS